MRSMAVVDDHVHAAQRQSRSVRRGNRPASRISVRAARAKIEFVIDQDQARKFWTGWVRREIGGSAMIQEAAVSAAVNELLLGHDNQAAAAAARSTAQQLAGPLNTGKPLFRRPWPYVAGVAGVAVAAIIVIFATRSVHNIGCLVGQTTLGHRTTTLHNAFVDVYNRDFKVIDACTSVDCEKAPKLEIAGSLKTYNDGLHAICWPDKYKAHATALMQANTAMADAVLQSGRRRRRQGRMSRCSPPPGSMTTVKAWRTTCSPPTSACPCRPMHLPSIFRRRGWWHR